MIKIIIFSIFSMATNVMAVDVYPLDMSKGRYDISKSWEGSHIYIPGSSFKKELKDISNNQPMPVVVFMHGGGGIGPHDIGWAKFLSSNGYVVVLPDSFSIPNRVPNSDPTKKIANLRVVPVNLLRPVEAEFALSQLKLLKWADPNNLFLMGHSEGANASTYIKNLGYSGLIISSNLCHHGFHITEDIPILAISFEEDTFLPNPLNFHCANRWDTYYPADSQNTESRKISRISPRKNATQVILKGKGHSTYDNSIAKESVLSFLKKNSK